MASKSLRLIVKLFIVAFVLVAYTFEMKRTTADSPTPQDMKRYEGTGKVKVIKIITLGDHSYIRFAPRLDTRGDEGTIETEILGVKNKFESDHPELSVTGWQVQSLVYVSSHSSNDGVIYNGIWVDHKPSGKPSKKELEKEKNRWPDPAEPNRDGGRRF